MKKVILVSVLCFIVGIVVAQQPEQKYSEVIQIKSDNNKIMATVDVSGKVTLSPGVTYDEIINILIIRMIKQNAQAREQIQTLSKLIEDAKSRATVTSQKAVEIFQTWNPQPPEQPKEVKEVKEVKKEETKKTMWQKIWGK